MKNKTVVTPGINKQVPLYSLTVEEKTIVRNLADRYWYITRIEDYKAGSGEYKIIYAKPTQTISECF